MFHLFKKKQTIEKLQIKYKNLLKEAYSFTKTDKAESEAKIAEASSILKQIEFILSSSS